MPPPKASPATPVDPTTPPGVTRPKAWVAESKSSQVTPPWARGIRARSSTSTRRIEVDHQATVAYAVSGGLWPPPRTATSSPRAQAESNASATLAAPRQRTIRAGRRSIIVFQQRLAES